ncbi:ras-related and estrogen-regulated growth inhibitor-like protein [Podospora australis]|uniref:Ras-related and estrogen-regulated growth inhibitor-like protein n=1 Tax=Podospora australis TaxID=1536484 RepID=A0AAN6WZQ1_9PEZI|nr:ras-related and estrogen-regulated growth inhibitor-like protein [Podospora australis]
MVNSFLWTPEEATYLKAVLRWQDDAPAASEQDRKRRRQQAEEAEWRRKQELLSQEKPAGEFRVLVIGGKGTGKSSILTRFAQNTFTTSPSTSKNHPNSNSNNTHDPFYEKGCRHPILLSPSPSQTSSFPFPTPPASPSPPSSSSSPQKEKKYIIDALEFPSQHLLSNPLLEQALAITECAVLVYDVTDEASFRLCLGVAEFIRDHFSGSSSPSSPSYQSQSQKRLYEVVLVGTKADVDNSESESDDPANRRQVSYTEGKKAAAGISMPGGSEGIPFLEVSAKTGENVFEIFPTVGREILRLKKLAQTKREQQAEKEVRDRLANGEGFNGSTQEKGARSGRVIWLKDLMCESH